MRKKALVILFAALAAMQITACGVIEFKKPEVEISGPKINFGATATVGEKTVGTQTTKTADKGYASYNIDGKHVHATNFEFDVPEGFEVKATSNDENGIVYNGFIFSQNGNNKVLAMEGTYKEPITKSNYNEAVNKLVKTGFEAKNELDFASLGSSAMVDDVEDDVLYTAVNDNLSNSSILIKTNGAGGYVMCIYNTEGLGEVMDVVRAIGFGKFMDYSIAKHNGNNSETSGSSYSENTGSGNSSWESAKDNYQNGSSDSMSEAEKQAMEIIRETHGSEDEYKEGNAIGYTEVESPNTVASISMASQGYTLTLDNKSYTLAVPDAWVEKSTGHLIFASRPDMDGVEVSYGDSFIKVGDESGLMDKLNSMEKSAGTEGQLGTIPLTTKSGENKAYLIIMKEKQWNSYHLYQAVPGYDTYLEINITDYDQKYDADTLIMTFGANV